MYYIYCMKQKVYQLLNALGAEIEIDKTESGFDYTIDAPEGYYWNATGANIICGAFYKGQEKVNECYQRMIDDIKLGFYEV